MHDQGASGALLMSAGSMTAAARAWARGKPVELWDVEALAALPSPMPDEAALVSRQSRSPSSAAPMRRPQTAHVAEGRLL